MSVPRTITARLTDTDQDADLEQLREFIDTCPLLDHHCHCLMELEPPVTVTSLNNALLGTLTEAQGKAREQAVHSIAVKRSIRELASALSADATSLEGVAAARLRLGEEAANQKLFGATRISALLIDDGLRGGVAHNGDVNWGVGGGESGSFEPGAATETAEVVASAVAQEGGQQAVSKSTRRPPEVEQQREAKRPGEEQGGNRRGEQGGEGGGERGEEQKQEQGEGQRWRWRGVAWHESLVPVVRRVLRLETSIAAYRCGLSIDPFVTPSEVEIGIQATLASVIQTSPPSLRLCDPRVISFCIATALAVAAKHQLPLQIHCGFGDRDLDLAAANPLCLRSLLEYNEGLVEVPVGEVPEGEAHAGARGKARGLGCSHASYAAPIVLLHSCYPFMREASYLASVYTMVYVDCGLVFSKLSLSGMKAALLDLLDLAPLTKVMMSTDAVGFAEPYYLSAMWGRRILFLALASIVQGGDLTLSEAFQAACGILHNNALRLYRIDMLSVVPPAIL
ncbi:unnamed protein product [Closterium sp. NIES-64]|nr:unnamed protein product [Closterium sp. NIES-64]